jgi:hypothetical protein
MRLHVYIAYVEFPSITCSLLGLTDNVVMHENDEYNRSKQESEIPRHKMPRTCACFAPDFCRRVEYWLDVVARQGDIFYHKQRTVCII